MATVGHMMSQITKNRAVITDPVSKVIYTQFKQVQNPPFNISYSNRQSKIPTLNSVQTSNTPLASISCSDRYRKGRI